MFKHIFTLAGLLLAPLSLHADTISYSGYELNTQTNIVTGEGLEWLQWDETVGISPNKALGVYGGAGWRLASLSDMHALFNAFDFGRVFDNNENTTQRIGVPQDPSEDLPGNHFIELFGDTYRAAGNLYDNGGMDPYQYSIAMFGLDEDGDGFINRAMVYDDYYSKHGFWSGGLAELTEDEFLHLTVAGYRRSMGVALVRNVSEVPLPAAGYLFITALFGVIGAKNRSHSSTR
jgi:hypothetical protein